MTVDRPPRRASAQPGQSGATDSLFSEPRLTSLPRNPLAHAADTVWRRRVLVAEDNERLAELVAAVLAASGYEVVVAGAPMGAQLRADLEL